MSLPYKKWSGPEALRAAVEESPHPAPEPSAVVHDQAAAQEDLHGKALEVPALIEVVVGAVLGDGDAVANGSLGIPDHNVGVGAGRESPFLRIQPEDPGGVGRGQRDELIWGEPARPDPVGPQDRHAIADAGEPVGDLREVIAPKFFARNRNLLAFVLDRLTPVEEKRAVIGPDGLDDAFRQATPQAGVIRFAAHWRGADPLSAVRTAKVVQREEQVGRAGFPHDRQAAVARIAQLIHFAGHVHVDDVGRRFGLGGEGDGPERRLDSPPPRPSQGVPFGSGVPGLKGLGDEDVDHIAVFAVNHRQQAMLPAATHDLEDLTVLEAEPAVVGGEDLERRDPFVGQAADLVEHGGVHAGDVHMKGEIDGGLGVGLGVPLVDPSAQRARGGGGHEVDDSGCAAEGSRLVAGVVVVRRDRLEHREVEMRVRVDPTGEEKLASDVDGVGAGRGRGVDGGDRFAFDQEVGPARVAIRDDRAALEQDRCRHHR
jgi:hypothetical protein